MSWPPRPGPEAVVIVGALGAAALSGRFVAQNPTLGVLLALAIGLAALVATRPAVIAIVALVGSFAVQRLGGTSSAAGSGGGIAYADALLVVAGGLALLALIGSTELKRLQVALFGLAIYLAALVPAVILDDSTRSIFEWVHRLVLIGAAMLVGAWIARDGLVSTALRALVAVTSLMSALAIIWTLTHGFAPASPLGLHKNFVGALLSIVIIVVVTGARHMNLSVGLRVSASLLIASGLLASQSRGSMIAAAAGILLVVALEPRAQGRTPRILVLVVSAALVFVAYQSLSADLALEQDEFENSSLGVRQQVEARTQEIWRTSPITGVGLKYFNSGEWGPLAQPANVVINNELAESGIVGLGGFVVMQGVIIIGGIRRRKAHHLAGVGTACVAAALTHGIVDIYWTAGTVSLPFIIYGMAMASSPAPAEDDETGQPKVKRSTLARI